ncbi:HupE/UreJ family protein [Snodgrassella sp. CFCC 13594]|uniref:HupE/UreJ family protein n=1 Tax=Snodgrassella sp. CFCC 13594 TaxID=1775559 RepID=UPI0008323055|nr:HupE/UreJ family protein [Snodgrassella sp. CFCC 13594]
MKKALSTLLLLIPTLALAHPGHGTDGLLAGLTHPITGWDHLLAMLAVGLWAASFSGKARWLVPSTFVIVMMAGFALGTNGIKIPMMEQGIAASVMIMGLAAAWIKKIPLAAAMTLVGMFALFHGMAHGAELGTHGARSFAIGFVMVTAALHAVGFALGHHMAKRPWTLHLSGSLIGLVGLGMLMGA